MKQINLIIILIFIQLCFIQHFCLSETNPNYINDYTSSQIGDKAIVKNLSHELIVRVNPEISFDELRKFSLTLGAESLRRVFLPNTPAGQHQILSRIYQITFPSSSQIKHIHTTYIEQSFIEAVEFNRLNRFCSEVTPEDPFFDDQWNLRSMNLPKAWAIEKGVPSVVVAVVDSGIMLEHPELQNQLWHNQNEVPSNGIDDDMNGYVDDIVGWDFTDAPSLQGHGDSKERDNQPDDETGHGTQVSGIIAAETDNGTGIAGVAWNCKIMTLRAGFRVGGGAFLQNDDVAAAIVYAADNGAQVINLSLGDTVNAFLIRDAVEYAYNRGCLLVAAAGNSSEPVSLFPAALQNVISVAALDSDWQLGGSNFGSSIDIAAPGEDILTTDLYYNGTATDERYGYKSGTSMAAAHVSGVAALLFSANPSCSNTQVQQWLNHSVRQLTIPQLIGAGLIDAHAALNVMDNPIAMISVDTLRKDETSKESNLIEITGSAGGEGFIQFWLDYGISETPDLWFPIGIPQTEPRYNSVLYQWNTSDLEDGFYTLRLSVASENGKTGRDKMIIEIRKDFPKTSNHEGSVWLSGNHYESYVIWQTDVLTAGSVEIFDPSNKQTPFRIAFSDSMNTQHLVNISDLHLPSGQYQYVIKSQNRSGLIYTDDNDDQFFSISINDRLQNNTHLNKSITTSKSLQAVVSPIDLNRNGKKELIALDNTNMPQIYELNDKNTFVVVESWDESISLFWDIADIDGDGLIEILANKSETTFLLEQPEHGKFPTKQIWQADGIWGGTIEDTDLDGIPDIITRHDATNSIWIFEPDGNNSFSIVAMLNNPTQGTNNLHTRFAIDDFDADGRIEILIGDSDSELFIYENFGDNIYRHTWTGELNGGIPSLFSSGDLNADSIPEFVVGSKVWTTEFDLPRQHWNFTVFTSNGDNSYQVVWNQRIRELQDGFDGMTIADANNDGKKELCISVSPNFYLIQHDGTSYQTIWHHPSSSTFNPIVTDIDNDGNHDLIFNSNEGLAVFNNTQSNGDVSRKVETTQIASNTSPLIVSAEHSPPNQVLLSFNRQMEASTAIPSRYLLHRLSNVENTESVNTNGQVFSPQSAIFDRSKKRVILSFENSVFFENYLYEIETIGLTDIKGSKIPDDKRKIRVELKEDTDSRVLVYPNPARGNVVTFDSLPADSTIFIYDVSGHRIKTLNSTEIEHSANRCKHIWSLDGVSSGVYIYMVESESERQIGKVSVIR